MNFLKQCYLELKDLEYSEDNVVELFSIANRIIKNLKSKNPSRKTNTALHYVMITYEKEFQYFKEKKREFLKDNFKEARSYLMSDLTTPCNK